MKRNFVSIIAIILIILGMIFSPWVTVSFAKNRAIHSFEGRWKNVQDGCGFNCKDCGIKTTKKVLFGRKVTMEYACGLLPSDSPKYHKTKELFVSLIGTVH
ncbi:hypothetical protein GC096_33010 [Paenibacillus sp. LMG 31461]|uniref:Uncharacterized protein n=1 Tax=Paenibacillus plantarum TaxID=2654975 RepID=A0ABX1XLW2_9BACL|nr:hypothetical protein [Paenibacillus plantarum]NOU68840.1 hypothetical protein [Paenibacillus plantarum]